jgi:hypothetical protein
MQYAQRQVMIPGSRKLLVPVLALAIGVAGATGVYSLIDEGGSSVSPADTKVIVVDPPAQPSPGVAAKNEAGVATAIAQPSQPSGTLAKDEAGVAALMGSSAAYASPQTSGSTETKDEAATAASLAPPTGVRSSTETKDEAATAASLAPPSGGRSSTETKDEAGTAAAIAPSRGSVSQPEADSTDPHGPAAALP